MNERQRMEDIEDRARLRGAHRDELRFGRSLHSFRLKYSRTGSTNRERAFARVWFKRAHPWLYSSPWADKLRALLTPYATDPRDEREHFVTKREAQVAATIIQSLGTNVGFAFLEEALREAGYVVRKINDTNER